MNIERVKQEFLQGFKDGSELGASVSVWKDGEEVMTLCEGYTNAEKTEKWTTETLAPVFSGTKGPAAATFILCLDEVGMDLDSEIRRVWREFPISGATFGDLISHQCGFAGLDKSVSAREYEEVISAIEEQEPLWEPMTAHGYHPRLVGFVQEEIVRRLTGESLGKNWRDKIAAPSDIDFWIGLPETEDHRMATLYGGAMTEEQLREDPFYRLIGKAGSIPNKAFKSPTGVQGAAGMNKPRNWHAGYAAMGGVGSARALAKFYQDAMGHLEGSLLTESIRSQFNARRVNGDDLVLCAPTSFGGGFMLDPVDENGNRTRELIGSDTNGFGHPGAGGCHAFADPTTGYSFAYVMNQMEVSVLPGEKVKRMLEN